MKDAIYIPDDLWTKLCEEIIVTDMELPSTGRTTGHASTDRPTSTLIKSVIREYLEIEDKQED